jgi:integrase
MNIYQRLKLPEGWRYKPVAEGVGKRTGSLSGPFYIHPTKNGMSQWLRLDSMKFNDAKLEAAQFGRETQINTAAAQHGAKTVPSRASKNSPPRGLSTDGNRILVTDAIENFLLRKQGKRAPKTVQKYTTDLARFSEWLPSNIRFVDQITDGSVLERYMAALLKQGLSAKTVSNSVMNVCFMLKSAGVMNPSKTVEFPAIEEEPAIPYSEDDLTKIFAKAMEREDNEYARYLFFLTTACREQEVSTAEWSDIDWTRGRFHIHSKSWTSHSTNKEQKFTPKTHESRQVPLSVELVRLLQTMKKSPKADPRWVFPNENHDPDGHFLRKFKKLCADAGLNCGQCQTTITVGRYNKQRQQVSCGESAGREACAKHYLHRLRKTRATFWHEQGIPSRTIQHYLGHKSLVTTERYLGIVEDTRLQGQINAPMFKAGLKR